ncbi:hypothetical protein D9757_003456 [Collybiopsis confluens]|uniref:Sas10 C-terminal domain-containing protein n=1 Tax=Collybiopsis confluens TaxID=2823264 RepID=A0A8H5HU44_9AGAR|nr:hypothetical protein D9757_003456 [Collybiopsis confluens]
MPRRPSKKSKNAAKPRKADRSDAAINKWNVISDIPLDEEDQFHTSRDRILLEDNDGDDDENLEDEEVFALQGMSDDEEENEADEVVEGGFEKEEKKSTLKSRKDSQSKKKNTPREQDSDEEDESWGRGRAAYYSSNANQIDSDDEEALQLEEQEARRLQAKSRDDMNAEDFGLEDPIELEVTTDTDVLDDVRAVLPDKAAILHHLQKTDPESLALARDWTDSASSLVKIKQKLEQLDVEPGSTKSFFLGMMHLHYQTLLTYTTTLAFYLHLRASQKYARKPELMRAHPVMQRLLKLKSSLITLEDLNFAASDDEDDSDEGGDKDDMLLDAQKLWSNDHASNLEVDLEELDDLLADARMDVSPEGPAIKIPPLAPPKKKRKTAAEFEKKKDLTFDLVEPEFKSSISSSLHLAPADAFGEVTSLQHSDAVDKSARRKSLRFHTSRIESANARRSNARHNALGGDDDIPYRERKREREERLSKEAKARLQSQGGADLDDSEPAPRMQDEDDDGDIEMGMENGDGYYDLVKKKTKAKKEKKKTDYEASREERFVEEEIGEGPRSLTRAILANKGLTPHRSKSVRNPRVKKRLRFAKAQKKVASQKPVYKGGVSSGGGRYEGEKSGISKVVKSIRLG